MVPYLKLKEGQSLEVTEKFLDSIQGDYRFDVTVSSALSEMPEIGRNIAFYTLPILVPMDTMRLSRISERIVQFTITGLT